MKTIDDALELRRRIFGAFEMAEVATDRRREARSGSRSSIVGAGPTGVEIAGQIRELASRSLRGEFRNVRSRPRCACCSSTAARNRSRPSVTICRKPRRRELRTLGVELHDGRAGHQRRRVRRRRRRRATAPSTSPRTPWSGPRACRRRRSPRSSPTATGAEVDRAGRIAPLPDLTLPGHPEVFVVGDMVTLDKLPGVAEVAMQGSLHAANTIARRLARRRRGRAVPLPRPRERRDHRPLPRDLQLLADPAQRLPAWFVWVVRAPRVPQRVRQPLHDDVALGPVDGRPQPGRTRVQRRAHRRRPERARGGAGTDHADAVPPGRRDA